MSFSLERPQQRLQLVAAVLALLFMALVVRAVDLHWWQAGKLQARAEKQRLRQFPVAAPRGQIFDAHGRLLAGTASAAAVAAIGSDVPADRVGPLARALGRSESQLRQHLRRHAGFSWLARQLDPEVAAQIEALKIPGVRIEQDWRRVHPAGPQIGHLLGFVGIDGHGLEGVELAMDKRLAGSDGFKQLQRDARRNELPGSLWLREPKPGANIALTIDATIQNIAYAALYEAVQSQRASGGSVIVMRPSDGAVLAMANWPGFNPNDYRNYRAVDWRNRAVTDLFEPGSTLKPFTVAAALASDRWRADSRIYCENGKFKVANRMIHDVHPEGWLTLSGMLAKSSNVGAAKLGLDVGAKPLYTMLGDLGLTRRSGIGLRGEASGMVLPPERWGPVETANIAFGQGIAITPLQLATAFCVLANDGLYQSPRLVQESARPFARRVMSPTIAHTVLKMLAEATGPDGTGLLANPPGYKVAGKTGTAQRPDPKGGYSESYTAVFAGAVPAEKPELVIVAVVDEPKRSIFGGTVAAPVFRTIAAAALPYLGILPKSQPGDAGPLQVASGSNVPAASSTPSLYGQSLREARRNTATLGLRLNTHGSGWVVRQEPLAHNDLAAGQVVEVWLDE